MIPGINRIYCEKTGEEYYTFAHESGLKVIVYPKKFSTYYASLCVRFGSMNEHMCREGEDEEVFSDGIAHFIEHKMFEKPGGGDAFEDFAEFGGNGNAYTTKDYTSYLFSCTENFEDNLRILLSFVFSPYFTDENVEKEKGIIAEEIKMYDENPASRLYREMLMCLYKNNPIRRNICGSVESISKITPAMLYRCYNEFYCPSNMYLTVCGDTTVSETAKIVDSVFNDMKTGLCKEKHNGCEDSCRLVKKSFSEPISPVRTNSKTYMDISIPSVLIAFKCDGTLSAYENEKKAIAYDMLSDMLFGKSSEFYYRMYCSGLTSSGIYLEYEWGDGYAHSSIAIVTENPEVATEQILSYIEEQKMNPVKKEEFERIKKTAWAEYMRGFDSTEEIAESLVSSEACSLSVFDEADIIEKMDYEYIIKILKEDFSTDKMAVSVLLPKGEMKKC